MFDSRDSVAVAATKNRAYIHDAPKLIRHGAQETAMARLGPLDNMIAECRSKLGEASRAVEALEIELRALERARAAVSSGKPELAGGAAKRRRPRALKSMWQDVLRFVGTREAQRVSIDAIWDQIQRENLPIERNTLRSQLSIYAERGYLERIGVGEYKLTQLGMIACNLGSADGEPDYSLAAASGNEHA